MLSFVYTRVPGDTCTDLSFSPPESAGRQAGAFLWVERASGPIMHLEERVGDPSVSC